MNFRNVAAAVLLCLGLFEARAESGPIIPCDNCDMQAPAPETGFWYNPQQSGSGMAMESQDGLLLGAMYTYDADGRAQWFTFSSRLEEATVEGHAVLRATAPLEHFARGMCLNCPYSLPEVLPSPGQITIEFTKRNYASYSIDGGEKQFIIPLVAGVDASEDFAPLVPYGFPELDGQWSFVLDNPAVGGLWGTSSVVLRIGPKGLRFDSQGSPTDLIYSILLYSGNGPDISQVGTLMCLSDRGSDGNKMRPVCHVRLALTFPGLGPEIIIFPIEYANIGDARIYAEDPESGIRLEAFRINFD